jgi:flagellar biosynthesis/type III secretory pathway M-ring protein FliF/YscJ
MAASGDLKKVSVAVLVDGFFTVAEDGSRVFNPLPEERLAQLREAIENTIGYNEARGDTVSVTSLEFYREETVSVWAVFLLDLLREFGRPFINLLLIILFFIFVIRPILNWLKKEVEPVGSGAEQAVLPDYPSPVGGGESLPLPLPPREAPSESVIMATAPGAAAEESVPSDTLPEEAEPIDQYEDEEMDEMDEEAQQLAYGQLTRDKVMPMARDNMDRTVGLIRSWIEQRPQESAQEK